MKLKNKVAIITGGSRGIGYATAEKFIKEGAAVIITASSPESAEKAAQKLRQSVLNLFSNKIKRGFSDGCAGKAFLFYRYFVMLS